MFRDYMLGVGNGMLWTNSALKVEGRDQLFCNPSKLLVHVEDILSLVDQEIRQPSSDKKWFDDNTPVEMIMLHVFRVQFPCEQQRKQLPKEKE